MKSMIETLTWYSEKIDILWHLIKMETNEYFQSQLVKELQLLNVADYWILMKMHTPKTSGQIWIQYWYADSFDYFPRKQVYYDLMYEANKKISNVEWFEDLETNHHNIIEILKDIPRTFTNYDIFAYHSLLRKLFRILLVFSEYNNGIQYVQGMNSIISILSVHCEEYIAFWLFWGLLENYNLDDIYSIGLEGMYSYINQIDNILK